MLSCVPYAHADSITFLMMAHQLGFVNTQGDAGILVQGQRVCAGLDAGFSQEAVATNMWYENRYLTPDQARLFVVMAVQGLCPWHGANTIV